MIFLFHLHKILGNTRQSVHEGIWYSCDQCDFKTADKIRVRKHTKSAHEGKVYKCDQCDYTSSNETRLRHHKKYRHKGLTFDCDQCDFKGASSGSLSRHTASIHEHRKFYCTICDYKSSEPLRLHRRALPTNHHSGGNLFPPEWWVGVGDSPLPPPRSSALRRSPTAQGRPTPPGGWVPLERWAELNFPTVIK